VVLQAVSSHLTFRATNHQGEGVFVAQKRCERVELERFGLPKPLKSKWIGLTWITARSAIHSFHKRALTTTGFLTTGFLTTGGSPNVGSDLRKRRKAVTRSTSGPSPEVR